jgi:hypothetical protein
MPIKPGIRDFLWMAVGAAGLLVVMLLVWHFHDQQNPAEQLAFKAKRIALVESMRLNLASASEAEKSAVMAITDADSQTYADQARAAATTVEQARKKLEELLQTGGNQNEKDLLAQFSQAFAEFKRIDKDLLDLAVKNTNLKASSLAFGPAATALKEMDVALARLVSDDLKVTRLADDARIAAWHLQALLPPHIAEESDEKMNEMEAVMAKEDQDVRKNLEALAAVPNLTGNPDLKAAASEYARFTKFKTQILKLSRENTNVRSLAISLNQKRKMMLICQDALALLEQAIQEEPIAGMTHGPPAKPR